MFTPLDDPSDLPRAYADAARWEIPRSPLTFSEEVDVAIVGGGFLGISAALHLAEAGVKAAVLEAKEIGSGGSGRALGQVVPYAKHDHRHIEAHYGPRAGGHLIDALAAGPDLVFGLIARHGIVCEAVRNGLIFAPHSAGEERSLEAQAAYWCRNGAPVDFLKGDDASQIIGSSYYPACLLDRRGGTVNPLAYVRGLARAALAGGASLYTHTKAVAIEREGAGWRVKAREGALLARSVIIGTGAYTDRLWPGLSRTIIPMRAHIRVSRPLSDNLRASVLPSGRSLTDTRRLYSGIRVRTDGRLQMSTDGPAFSLRGGPFVGKADRRVHQLFPQIGPLEWDEAWTGWVDMNSDFYPRIHEPAPGVWAALGLSGRGIAFATLLGRELAYRLSGHTEEMMLPVTQIRGIVARGMARPLVGGLIQAYRVLDCLEMANYVRVSAN